MYPVTLRFFQALRVHSTDREILSPVSLKVDLRYQGQKSKYDLSCMELILQLLCPQNLISLKCLICFCSGSSIPDWPS